MREEYFFRLDDACPTWDRQKWLRVAGIFERYGVKPLIAVVPDNKDPDLVFGESDGGFWDTLRNWENRGWILGLHGFQHLLSKRPSGLVPKNAYGEWAGDPLDVQRERMRQAWNLVQEQGWNPKYWVAPAHNMDRNTLEALEEETSIRIVSDGWSRSPYWRFGFLWLPQQLGTPRKMGKGSWTVTLHPNTMQEKDFNFLEKWLSGNHPLGLWESLGESASFYSIGHAFFAILWKWARSLRRKK